VCWLICGIFLLGGDLIKSLGFNNIIVSDNNFKEDHIKELFSFLCEYGFRRIIFSLDHDVTTTTISRHLDLKKSYFEIIQRNKPRGISVWLESNVLMSRDSIYEKQIERLGIKKTRFMLLSYPVFDHGDLIDSSINQLLYKYKKFPCFMSFERNISTYPVEFAKHLCSTRCSCFMIDINAFAMPSVIPYIEYLINSNAVIIPGFSGVISDYTALDDKLLYFKNCIGEYNYTKLLINSSKSNNILLGL
jgi:hypothetical protein